METVLNVLLIRFAIIVGAVVVLALVVFAVALTLKRRGKLSQARKRAAPVLRSVAGGLDARAERRGRLRATSYRGRAAGAAARAAARYLDDERGTAPDRDGQQ